MIWWFVGCLMIQLMSCNRVIRQVLWLPRWLDKNIRKYYIHNYVSIITETNSLIIIINLKKQKSEITFLIGIKISQFSHPDTFCHKLIIMATEGVKLMKIVIFLASAQSNTFLHPIGWVEGCGGSMRKSSEQIFSTTPRKVYQCLLDRVIDWILDIPLTYLFFSRYLCLLYFYSQLVYKVSKILATNQTVTKQIICLNSAILCLFKLLH